MILMIVLFTTLNAKANRFEAELATLVGVSTSNVDAGYSGTGYINQETFNEAGDKIVFNVATNKTGLYTIKIGYLAGEDKLNYVTINGTQNLINFTGTNSSWDTFELESMSLNNGNNTIEIEIHWGWMHIDYIEVIESPIAFNASSINLSDSLNIKDFSMQSIYDEGDPNVEGDIGEGNYLKIIKNNSSENGVFISEQGRLIVGTVDPCMRNDGSSLVVAGQTTLDIANIGIGLMDSVVMQCLWVIGEAFSSTSTNFTIFSDRRLKKNIKSFKDNSLDDFLKVKLYEYEYKNIAEGKKMGVMAQEIKEILPNSVGKSIHTDGKEYLNFNPSDLHYLHMKATQEMNEKMVDQEQTIQNLTQENESLEERLNMMENQMNEIYELLAQSNKPSEKQTIKSNTNFVIGQNIPNPSDDETSIPYFIPENANKATLTITDLAGKVLMEQNIQEIGNGNLLINTSSFPRGTYIYYLKIDGKISNSKKMIVK